MIRHCSFPFYFPFKILFPVTLIHIVFSKGGVYVPLRREENLKIHHSNGAILYTFFIKITQAFVLAHFLCPVSHGPFPPRQMLGDISPSPGIDADIFPFLSRVLFPFVYLPLLQLPLESFPSSPLPYL